MTFSAAHILVTAALTGLAGRCGGVVEAAALARCRRCFPGVRGRRVLVAPVGEHAAAER